MSISLLAFLCFFLCFCFVNLHPLSLSLSLSFSLSLPSTSADNLPSLHSDWLSEDTQGKHLANQIWIESRLEVTWEDNGRDYMCHSTAVEGSTEVYSDNCTQTLTVLREYSHI